MTDLVVLSLEGWDSVWRRNQYLVAGLLEADPGMRVLFVEPPDDPLHDLRSRRRPGFGRPVRQVGDRLWTLRLAKWLPRRLDPHGDERRSHAIRRAATDLGFVTPVLWVNDPSAAGIVQMTGWRSLYDITDDWLSASRPPAERARISAGERLLLDRADAVVVCSPELVRRKSAQRADLHLIPNAVDLDAYLRPTERPADLPAAVVALYVGTLHSDRIDVALCARVASELADRVHVVLAGPDLLSPHDRAQLDAAGVIRLGTLDRSAVPSYLHHADVLLVPHQITAFTDSLDPIKLYEYQAAGRPVVSTAVAGFRDTPDYRVRIADEADFADAVIAALTEPLPGGAVDVPDWRVRVEQMRQVLASIN